MEPAAHPQDSPPPLPGFPSAPWLAIWIRPRATLRAILDIDPRRHTRRVAAIAGAAQGSVVALVVAAGFVQATGFDERLAVAAALAGGVLFGPIVFIVLLHVLGALLWLTGRWLGGRGGIEEVRAAWAWSMVPGIAAALLWLPRAAFLGLDAFALQPGDIDNPAAGLFVGILEMIEAALWIWGVAIACKCVGEAHRFSAWRGLLAQILAALLILGPVVLLGIAVAIGRGVL